MTTTRPGKSGAKAWKCGNCGNDPIIERETEFDKPECPRCGETTLITRHLPDIP